MLKVYAATVHVRTQEAIQVYATATAARRGGDGGDSRGDGSSDGGDDVGCPPDVGWPTCVLLAPGARWSIETRS